MKATEDKNMKIPAEIQVKLDELETKVLDLDQERDDIWCLRFKDFEDLSRAVDIYSDNFDEANDLLEEILESLTKHIMKVKGWDEYDANIEADDYLEDLYVSARMRYHSKEVVYFSRLGI